MPGKNGEWVGKLPLRGLSRVLSKITVVRTPSVVAGPAPGEDAGIIDLGDCMLVGHVDPVTEAGESAGRLAVLVASNDVAVSGARPRWAQVLLLLPPGYPLEVVERIAGELGETAAELGIEIVGGHTEYSPGLSKPIIAVHVLGCACRDCITPTRNAMPGDVVVQIGYAGQEGAVILASDFKSLLVERGVPESLLEDLKRGARLSIVDVAVELAEMRLVTSMHDATEGGIMGALVELALASQKTVRVDKSRILVDERAKSVFEAVGVDPIKVISSGAMIATAPKCKVGEVLGVAAKHGYPASPIGEVLEGEARLLLVGDGSTIEVKEPPRDEISRFWER